MKDVILKTLREPIFKDERIFCIFCLIKISEIFKCVYFCEVCRKDSLECDKFKLLNFLMSEHNYIYPLMSRQLKKHKKLLNKFNNTSKDSKNCKEVLEE